MRVISGGQTGVDRAALDAAVECRLQSGGWCPRDRRAEDGAVPTRYMLKETPSIRYGQRTEWNIRDADATLILVRALPLSGGTLLTQETAFRLGKPVLVSRIVDAEPHEVLRWLLDLEVRILNIAGPRESGEPGIGQEARSFLRILFSLWIEHEQRGES